MIFSYSGQHSLNMPTLVIDNFGGRLTRYNDGDINSGLAKYTTSFGNDPFSNPGNLTWFEAPTQIDSGASVITDLIMAARPRLESGITYVYAIGHTGRLYKIQVNDPTTYNPDYDNPVLLATLTAQSPTFKYGSSINFFGTTEQIYIGHDRGVTKVNFDGTSEAYVGALGSYTLNVPRPAVQFAQYLYFGNGTNLVQVLAGGTVGSYGVLNPALPTGSFVRDLDVSPEGNYIQITVSKINSADMTVITQDTNSLSSSDSFSALWDGVVDGNNQGVISSRFSYNSYSLNSNISFGPKAYTMGYDLGGAAVYTEGQKIISLPNSLSPNFGAMFSTGNLMGFGAPEQDSSALKGSLLTYGPYDKEIPEGLYRFFRIAASSTQTDIQQMPVCTIVSNLFYGASSAGYAGNKVGSAKLYFSTLETDSGPNTKYRFYKFTTVPTGAGTTIPGVYETQNQLFSKKITVKEVRLYTEPLVTNNSFTVALIGSNQGVITSSSKTFTVGSNVTSGDDFVWYNPSMLNTYTLGVRITNSGSVNWIGTKLEIDYEPSGR